MAFHEFNIPVSPVAKGRARSTKSGVHFTPAKTRKAEQDVRFFVSQHWKQEPMKGPLKLSVEFIFLRPSSVSEKKRPLHVVKPDCSNLLKLVEDSLNTLLWHDDSQIVSVTCEKKYGPISFIRLYVEELT